MTADSFVRVMPFVIAIASVVVTGLLAYANYRLSRDKMSLDRERLAHEKAIVFWGKKVEAYSEVWSAATEAYEEFLDLKSVADDPIEELHKWVLVRSVKEGKTEDKYDPKYIELEEAVKRDPDGSLPWMLSQRTIDPGALEEEVRKDFFFLSPDHRAIVTRIFAICTTLQSSKSREEFREAYYGNLEALQELFNQLNTCIDETFYGTDMTERT
jgi:hypothetical protein